MAVDFTVHRCAQRLVGAEDLVGTDAAEIPRLLAFEAADGLVHGAGWWQRHLERGSAVAGRSRRQVAHIESTELPQIIP